VVCVTDKRAEQIVVINSRTMGTGSDELGGILIKSFIYALTQQDELPKTILFYNGGAYLTCQDSPVLEDLQSLEAQGVELLTCGTCLDFYGLKDKLAVGNVTNMYVIVEKQAKADKVIRP
jgi:selenium metabolism protein YedF